MKIPIKLFCTHSWNITMELLRKTSSKPIWIYLPESYQSILYTNNIFGENTEEVRQVTLSKKTEESLLNRSAEKIYSSKVSKTWRFFIDFECYFIPAHYTAMTGNYIFYSNDISNNLKMSSPRRLKKLKVKASRVPDKYLP